MNRTMICCTILITIVSLSIGQERRDIIYLKNGDVIKGIIVENVFDDYVRIELMGGSILSYKYVDIEKIIKELGTNKTWLEYTKYYLESGISEINRRIKRNERYQKSLKHD